MNKLFKNQAGKKKTFSHKLFTEKDSPSLDNEDAKAKGVATTVTTSPTITDADNHNSQYDLNISDQNVFTQTLNYLLVRNSPFSRDIEVLFPFSIPKDNVMMIHDSIKEVDEDNLDEIDNDNNIEIENENDKEIRDSDNNNEESAENNGTIFYTIYSKNINNSPLYHCVLKQDYNDVIIGEAKRVSLVGEPTITIKSKVFFLDTELRRTGAFSNTWHFDFGGKDYRWKPIQLGAKGCDLVCELIEYDTKVKASTSADDISISNASVISSISARKNKIKIAILSRNLSNFDDRNTVGTLTIFKEAWLDVKSCREFEILLLLGCMVMLDIIETS